MCEKLNGANYDWELVKDQGCDKEIEKKFGLVLARLLNNRGLNNLISAEQFLFPDFSRDFLNPGLFTDMAKVLDRIFLAYANHEKIVVYGDYDADGICGSSVLARTFSKLGLDFEVYLPDREKEGYGLNEAAVRNFAEKNIKLIITVDCGISNASEVAVANLLGMEVIITDHHGIPKVLPEAVGIIHPLYDPNYPFKYLAGGGVAFKLAWALLHDQRSGLNQTEAETYAKWLLDLVAISTVADMVSLTGENRLLVKYGLMVMAKTKNVGLKNLIEVAQIDLKKLDTYSIGFQIAPRINAAGRMEHASIASDLLTTENLEEAQWGARNLQEKNLERQKQIEKIVAEALILAESEADAPAIIVLGQNWPTGLIGLVASKVIEIYNRPTIVASFHGQEIVASGRSIKEFDLIAALQKIDQYFIKYGGHKGAAGFSILETDWINFKTDFKQLVITALPQGPSRKTITLEADLKLKDLNFDLVESINQLAPFGESNPKPLFYINDLTVTGILTLGQDKKHLKLDVMQAGVIQKIIAFNFASRLSSLAVGQKISVAVNLGVNYWQDKFELQVLLVDYKID